MVAMAGPVTRATLELLEGWLVDWHHDEVTGMQE